MNAAYLDASAVVKLFKPERETAALEAVLTTIPTWISTELVAVEARCAARRLDSRLLSGVEAVLANVDLRAATPAIRERAGMAFARPLRAPDAIHAATALSLRDDLDAAFVYDTDLSKAIAAEGLRVISPGTPA